jgi:ATP-dependent phosphofructokinase / diphosphate-dependent phosphofructokinase
VTGIGHGWKGLLEKEAKPLTLDSVQGILEKGGTMLKSSRTNPIKMENGIEIIKQNMKDLEIDALVAIGGDDTLGVAAELYKNDLKVVGIPKTIDNDLSATDFCIGFDTAVNVVVDAVQRCRSTAESHSRVLIVEVMGRHAGWIAAYGGLAGGADCTLVPEVPFSIDDVCATLQRRFDAGKDNGVVVVAEGAKPEEKDDLALRNKEVDAFGHVQLGGIGNYLEKEIKERMGVPTRAVILGHIQRGGSPTVFDRVLGTRLGVKAVELISEGKFGYMVALKGNQIEPVTLDKATGVNRKLETQFYDLLQLFSGERS